MFKNLPIVITRSFKDIVKYFSFLVIILMLAFLVCLFPFPTNVYANVLESSSLEATTSCSAMHRLYNKYTGEHLYTSDEKEQANLVKAGWTSEGVGWYAPKSSKTPVYRLYNPYVSGGDHHYTMNETEYKELKTKGWRQEGIGWYSDGEKGVVLYRQYNPYAMTGTHNYSVRKSENDALVSAGWKSEGTAWYGVLRGTRADDVWSYSYNNDKTYLYSNYYDFYVDIKLEYRSDGNSSSTTQFYNSTYSIFISNDEQFDSLTESALTKMYPSKYIYGGATCYYKAGEVDFIIYNKTKKMYIHVVADKKISSQTGVRAIMKDFHF